MFLIVWTDDGFDRMNEIIRDHRSRKREFAVALRQITHQLYFTRSAVRHSRTPGT